MFSPVPPECLIWFVSSFFARGVSFHIFLGHKQVLVGEQRLIRLIVRVFCVVIFHFVWQFTGEMVGPAPGGKMGAFANDADALMATIARNKKVEADPVAVGADERDELNKGDERGVGGAGNEEQGEGDANLN